MDGLDEAVAGEQGAKAAETLRRQVAMGLDAAHANGGGEGGDGLRAGEVGDEDGLRPRGQGGDDGAGLVRGDLVLRPVGEAAEQAEGGGPGGVGGQGLGGGLEGAEFESGVHHPGGSCLSLRVHEPRWEVAAFGSVTSASLMKSAIGALGRWCSEFDIKSKRFTLLS